MVLPSADIFSKPVCLFLLFFLKKIFWEYQLSVKHFGSRSCPSGLIWVQIVCKGYQQTTLVCKEFMATIKANERVDEK